MKKKKLNRRQKHNILSVVPVTSRKRTGTAKRYTNLRGIMIQRVKVLELRIKRDIKECQRLRKAIIALKQGK